MATPLRAQLTEDFEDGEKTSYAGSNVELSSGTWYFNDALLGSLGNDKFNGSQGVRMDRRNKSALLVCYLIRMMVQMW